MHINPVDIVPAAALRLAVLHKLVGTQAVVGWADGRISERAMPEPYLIDLSLGGQLDFVDVANRLGEIGETADGGAVLDLLFTMLPDVSDFDFDRARMAASQLFVTALACLPYDGQFDPRVAQCSWLDDEFTLAADGVGDRDLALVEFREFVNARRTPDSPVQLSL